MYIPTISNEVFEVEGVTPALSVYTDQGTFKFNESGRVYPTDKFPSVYLATPENKVKLEQFYSITLAEAIVDKDLNYFRQRLKIILETQYKIAIKTASPDYGSYEDEGLKTLHASLRHDCNRLVNMYKSSRNAQY